MRRLLFILALGATPLLLLAAWCGLRVGFGAQGAMLTVGFMLAWVAALRQNGKKLWLAAFAVTAATLLISLATPLGSTSMRRVDEDGRRSALGTVGARILGGLIPEREAILVALDLRMLVDPLPGEEPDVVDDMRRAYARMPWSMSFGPTPAPATYLEMQAPNSFDLLVVEPTEDVRGTAIFLHGYGGNFAVQCHLFAEKVRSQGYRTACPSLSLDAHWDDAAGRRVLEATREYLRIDGRVIIAGLSDGGVALSKSWPEADAYIVVSGVSSAAQCPRKPVLALHGTRDRIASISYARRLAERCPEVELEAMETAHFLLATEADAAAEQFLPYLVSANNNSK